MQVSTVQALRTAGSTKLVSSGRKGKPSNGPSAKPDVSANGRYVVFTSWSDKLHVDDNNGSKDVFLHDLKKGKTRFISTNFWDIAGNAISEGGRISGNGRYIVFESAATNLDGADQNGKSDVFVRDLKHLTTTRMSSAVSGASGNGHSRIAGNGLWVAFYSEASDLIKNDGNGTTGGVFVRRP